MSDQLDRIERKLDGICVWMNGRNGDPGAKIRIDRLEGYVRRSARAYWAFVLALLATSGTVIAAIMTKS